MHTAKIARKDLKIRYADSRPLFEPSQTEVFSNVDFMPVVRLLSAVNIEQRLKESMA